MTAVDTLSSRANLRPGTAAAHCCAICAATRACSIGLLILFGADRLHGHRLPDDRPASTPIRCRRATRSRPSLEVPLRHRLLRPRPATPRWSWACGRRPPSGCWPAAIGTVIGVVLGFICGLFRRLDRRDHQERLPDPDADPGAADPGRRRRLARQARRDDPDDGADHRDAGLDGHRRWSSARRCSP